MCTGLSIYLEGRSVLKMSVYKYHLPSTLFQTTTYLTRKNTIVTVTLGHVYTLMIYTYCYTAGREGMNTANAHIVTELQTVATVIISSCTSCIYILHTCH